MILSMVTMSPMNRELIIGTLNAAGLKCPKRLLHVVNRLNYMNLDIICMQETTSTNKNTKTIENQKNKKMKFFMLYTFKLNLYKY